MTSSTFEADDTGSSEQSIEDVPVSVIYHHCVRMYNKMLETARLIPDGESEGEGEGSVIWEGALTKLVKSLDYSTPYYTLLKNELIRMGCIKQLRRGGGQSAPSQWWLRHEPTEELFRSAVNLRQPAKENTNQMLKDLNVRVSQLERTVSSIVAAIPTIVKGPL